MAAKDPAPAIGIDLGTTYSAVGVVLHGKVEIIANELGFFKTPSYVAFNDTERLIGEAAKKQAPMNPTNTVFDTKRLIGRKFDDKTVQDDIKNWPFKVKNCDSMPKIEIEYKGEKKEYFTEEISAMILGKMKEVAEAYLNKTVTDAVITVPAYFNNSQRQSTRDAAAIAGLNVLRIINEPTAAAIAYAFQNKDVPNYGPKKILVYDLGGGTFDVTILKMEGNNAKVLATAGDTHLGGEDFDNRLINWLVQEFQRKHGKDIRENKGALRRLRTACEQEKRILSSATQTSVEIDALCDGINFSMRISRPRFEELNADLFKSTLKPVEKALIDAKLQKGEIDEIILVGGSTRIPKIQKLLIDFFDGKKELSKNINSDEAVTYGAAVQADMLNKDRTMEICGLVLQDVTPLSLGIGTRENFNVMTTAINRNSAIPAKKIRRYSTMEDNQTGIMFPVYQGESTYAHDNHLLGKFLLTNIPLAPAGVSCADVTFEIDLNGILTVTAVDASDHTNNNSIIIENVSVHFSNEQIKQMVEEAKKYREEERAMKELNAIRDKLEQRCYDILGDLMDDENESNEQLGDPRKAILKYERENTLEWIMNEPSANANQYKTRLAKINDLQ